MEKVIVPIVAAVLGAIGSLVYRDLKSKFAARGITGPWTVVGNEFNKDLSTCCLFEETLKLKNDDRSVKARGKLGDVVREYSGYLNGEYLALSYHTREGLGTGIIFAEDPTGLKKVFVGYWQGLDCTPPGKRIVEGPVIFARGSIKSDNVENMKTKYREFLDTPCRVLPVPGAGGTVPPVEIASNHRTMPSPEASQLKS